MATSGHNKKRAQPERQERLAFMQWIDLNPNLKKRLIAIEGGGSRHLLEAINLKRIGVIAGVPDYFMMLSNNKYHGLFIEFKAGKNKLTIHQKIFFENAEKLGYKCIVVWSWEVATQAIKDFMQDK